ncbi:putative ABC transport system permease protein [Actinacidiphila yanglinensis]|uniref:Putative ABC transport system permease protein n=1 Tax=Actinacidiphila yanglinensis TaxID=310779 RepID=A0A1H6B0B8_9ACTN|nr:FtsX-like permease family protein [Actinacidiphila yanglinensis]SEG53546.1 putative ABC transport system permease protein [Actinacidiphila yanglinensis]
MATGLARASVRHRQGGCTAGFLSVFLGAAILMAFASMLDTAGGPGVHGTDRTTLTIMAMVVGGWGAIVVASAVGTTLAVAARQRASELALLRSLGATPGQAVRLVVGEVALVGVAGVLAAIPFGYGGGCTLLRILQDTGQVHHGVGYRFGAAALAVGAGGCLLAALTAAWVTARRGARRRVRDAQLAAATGGRRISRFRLVAGVLLVLAGANCAVLTATVMDGGKLQTQSVAGEGAILSSIGFALLAPVLLRASTAVLGPVLRALGAPGELGVLGVRRRFQRAATPMMPIVVCTAISAGTLSMQATWNSAHPVMNADDKGTATLNYVVVGMIAVFAAVMLVNLVVAETTARRREFAQLRLTGATPRQVLRLVTAETVLTLVTGLLFGLLASLMSIVPYSLAVTDKALPDASFAICPAVVAGVAVLTLAAGLGAARRSTRAPAVGVLRGAVAS